MNKLLRNSLLYFFFIAVTTVVSQAQNAQLPTVIPPSPEAAAFFRFLDYPVNHATGIPSISVPIYEIKSGSLSVPISISYHAGGRRLTDETGPVGLGWSLNAGGMISRTVYGKPDEDSQFPYLLKREEQLTNKQDYEYLSSVYNDSNGYGQYSTEYDIFSYSFGSKAGKFILSQQKDSIYLIPLKPYQFALNRGFPSSVVDEQGVRYEFNSEEHSTGSGYASAVTTKRLTRIISADQQDTITFSYEQISANKANPTTEVTLLDDNTTSQQLTQHSSTTPTLFQQYTTQCLRRIKFKEGSIEFNRLYANNQLTNRLASIQIQNKQGVIIKAVEFDQQVLDRTINETTYKLSALYFLDRNDKRVEKYVFEYYSTTATIDSNSRDFWGFYNGIPSNGLLPFYSNIWVIDSSPLGPYGGGYRTIGGGANRTPSIAARNGVLRKITYPTGGSTEFEYELNRAKRGAAFFDCPGLRIKQIRTSDAPGSTPLVKTYTYGSTGNTPEDGYGQRNYLTTHLADMSYETRHFSSLYRLRNGDGHSPYDSYRKRVYSSEFLPGVADFANEPTFYPIVTEYTGTPENNIGKTVYYYSTPAINTVGSYSPPRFPTELPQQYGYPAVAAQYTYPTDGDLRVPFVRQYNMWYEAVLTGKSDYKTIGQGVYKVVRETSYAYQTQRTNTLRGFHIYKYLIIPTDQERLATETAGLPLFLFADYYITTGKQELVGTTETVYGNEKKFVTATTYKYNDNLLLDESQQLTSTGKKLITQRKYPFDFSTEPVYRQMVNRHMLDYVVEQRTLAEQQPLTTQRTTYQALSQPTGASLLVPARTETATGTAPLETKQIFDFWDHRGHILTRHAHQDIYEAFQWGYNHSYPIARVLNAQNQQTRRVAAATSTGTVWYSGSQEQTAMIVTATTGTVKVSLNLSEVQESIPSGYGSRAKPYLALRCALDPQGTAGNPRQSSLRAGSSQCVNPGDTVVTFTQIPAGTYLLRFTPEALSFSPEYAQQYCFPTQRGARIRYTYPTTATTLTGTSEFYYESFEENFYTQATTEKARTGRKGMQGDFHVPFVLPNTRRYLIDWQQWDGTKWVYHREPYTQPRTLDAAGYYLDDVRVYPADAQMTTYTYEPLMGMTSQTDPNGRATFYEYDSFGRLKRVRDEQGRLLTEQQYHLANQ